MKSKLLKVFVVLAVLIVLLAVFISFSGIQYTLAYATHGFTKTYFDASKFDVAQNCGGATPCGSGPLKVMTYNVLCRICAKPGFDNWDTRLPHLFDMVAKYEPDLLGTQELGGDGDLGEFLQKFPQYDCVTYRFGRTAYGDAALFYRVDRFEVVDSGQMWLSPNPKLPFGFSWKSLSMPRYVNWACLRQKSNGFTFLHLNTHFDNAGVNKEPAAVLFANTFRPIAAHVPIIVTGDFNTDSTTKRYINIKGGEGEYAVFADTMETAAVKQVVKENIPDGVAHNKIDEFTEPAKSIDHIFVGGPGKPLVAKWVQDASVYGPEKRWPSDHPAVYAEVELSLR